MEKPKRSGSKLAPVLDMSSLPVLDTSSLPVLDTSSPGLSIHLVIIALATWMRRLIAIFFWVCHLVKKAAIFLRKRLQKLIKKKALELHPDKRPNDRNAHADILRLNASYAILKDEKAKKSFDDLMRVKREKAPPPITTGFQTTEDDV
ncbi:hypothetical protein RHGRI_036020 [Rhododendron griersonianum]|uniref:J domain-containing protein n=1 Tax=Rhododendron griersonianum TaxID=479676 RepID=A0AAV6HMD9_9ERIC|nr:hypothetical protein RHGRI_036020 [Rhododendron griersonianum]